MHTIITKNYATFEQISIISNHILCKLSIFKNSYSVYFYNQLSFLIAANVFKSLRKAEQDRLEASFLKGGGLIQKILTIKFKKKLKVLIRLMGL